MGLTLPHALRARLAYDGLLLGAVVRLFADTVLGWYRRRMEIAGAPGGRGGAVTVVQRVSSDLRCNPHVHAMFVDGVFVPAADGGVPTFHALPHISDTAVADVLQISRTRILRLLIRRGVEGQRLCRALHLRDARRIFERLSRSKRYAGQGFLDWPRSRFRRRTTLKPSRRLGSRPGTAPVHGRACSKEMPTSG